MRIIQVIHSLTFGGAENQVLSLSIGLQKKGHAILLAAPKNSWLEKEAKNNGILFEHLRMSGVWDLLSYIKLHFLIRSFHADIVHGHQVRPSQYVGWATKGTKAISLSTAHSTNVRKHMRECHHIIGVSDAVIENLIQNNYDRKKLTRIYNGVKQISFLERQQVRNQFNISPNVFAVVLAGRFHRDKGFDLLIEVSKQLPDFIQFYFMGDHNNEYGHNLKQLAKDNNKIHFLGYQNNVPALLLGFDLYVAPSRREAFSLSLAEAESAALPIVASRVGGIPEVVSDGENGLLVPVNDVNAFADRILKFATNPRLCETMGKNGRLRYMQNFTVDLMVDQTESLYQKLLAK